MNQGILAQLDHRKIGLGLGVALVTMVTAAAATAALVSGEILAPEHMGYGAAAALLLASFLGAHSAGDAVNGITVCTGVLLVLLGLNAAFYGASVEGLPVTALAISGGCGASILIQQSSRGRKHHRRRRGQNR